MPVHFEIARTIKLVLSLTVVKFCFEGSTPLNLCIYLQAARHRPGLFQESQADFSPRSAVSCFEICCNSGELDEVDIRSNRTFTLTDRRQWLLQPP